MSSARRSASAAVLMTVVSYRLQTSSPRVMPSSSAWPASPKLRCGGWVDSWLNWGFVGLVGRRFWLRGGQGDWGADEVEGAALVGGGFGEHGDVGVGVVVADLVAGQGGQVIEQAAEAAQWGAVGGLVTGGFGLGGGGALCGGVWVVAAGWVLVGESQWRPGVA